MTSSSSKIKELEVLPPEEKNGHSYEDMVCENRLEYMKKELDDSLEDSLNSIQDGF